MPDPAPTAARYTTINGAIHAVVAGGTVVVCPGTYRTEAAVLKPVRLEGRDALIDAASQKPVIPGLPGGSGIVVLYTHKVIVTGFVVVGAASTASSATRSWTTTSAATTRSATRSAWPRQLLTTRTSGPRASWSAARPTSPW